MKEKNRKQFAYLAITLVSDICLILAIVLIVGVIFNNFSVNYFWLGLGSLFITAVSKLILNQNGYFKK